MTPLEITRRAQAGVVKLELFPGLFNTELQDFPTRYCVVSHQRFEFDQVFSYGLPIAADGYGYFWVVDLHPDTTTSGPIYFACHDAPVMLY
jgi:hypothetical protein